MTFQHFNISICSCAKRPGPRALKFGGLDCHLPFYRPSKFHRNRPAESRDITRVVGPYRRSFCTTCEKSQSFSNIFNECVSRTPCPIPFIFEGQLLLVVLSVSTKFGFDLSTGSGNIHNNEVFASGSDSKSRNRYLPSSMIDGQISGGCSMGRGLQILKSSLYTRKDLKCALQRVLKSLYLWVGWVVEWKSRKSQLDFFLFINSGNVL